jgi:predicted dehydrogenase
MDMTQFAEMTAQADRRGVALVYGLQLRFTSAAWLAQLIRTGLLGEVYHVDAVWHRRAGTPPGGVFTQQRQSGGGPGMGLLPHVLDLACLLVGYPVVPATVTAATHLRLAGRGGTRDAFGPARTDVEDTITGLVRLAKPQAVTVAFAASWEGHVERERLTAEVRGTTGGARLDFVRDSAAGRLVPALFTQLAGAAVEVHVTAPDGFLTVDQCYAAEIADLVDVARSRRVRPVPARMHAATPDEAGAVLATIVAAYRSAETGGTVDLLAGGDRGELRQDQIA